MPSSSATPPSAGLPASCPLLADARSQPVAAAYVSPTWYDGAGGYEAARRDHDTRSVPVFVYFFTDWCQYCRAFERDLLSTSEVERFLRDAVIKVRVNPEQSAEERALAERLGVGGYPTLLLLLDGEEPRRVPRQVERDGERVLRSPEDFIAGIERIRGAWLSERLRRARSLWQAGDARAALAQVESVLAVQPELAAAHVERALAHDQAQATDEALDDLRRAYSLDSRSEPLYQALDRVLARRQRWDETAACWTRLLDQAPGNAGALLARGETYYRKGDAVHALADAREACRLGQTRACELVSRLGA